MKRWAPVVVALIVVGIGIGTVVYEPSEKQGIEAKIETTKETPKVFDMPLVITKRCARLPKFLSKAGIVPPVVIDLSQRHYKGVALLFGRGFAKAYHPKQWEQYGYMGTYTLDENGTLYMAPTPYISIEPTTFNLQKKIYTIDTLTGRLKVFMTLDDIRPSADNPYGIISVAYDCDDRSLWVSAIDRSDYAHSRGRIYHIDVATKRILQRFEGYDALTLLPVKTSEGKYLLTGDAKQARLVAFPIVKGVLRNDPYTVATLNDPLLRVRKIKPYAPTRIKIEAFRFAYTLVAQSQAGSVRKIVEGRYDTRDRRWYVSDSKKTKP